MDKRIAKLLSKNELVRLVTSLREDTRSLRTTIAIQREFLKLYTGRDVDADLNEATTRGTVSSLEESSERDGEPS